MVRVTISRRDTADKNQVGCRDDTVQNCWYKNRFWGLRKIVVACSQFYLAEPSCTNNFGIVSSLHPNDLLHSFFQTITMAKTQ